MIGSTLQKPLGTRTGKCDLVLRAVVVEDELTLGIGDAELGDAQTLQTFHHCGTQLSLFRLRLLLSLGGGLRSVGLSSLLCTFSSSGSSS